MKNTEITKELLLEKMEEAVEGMFIEDNEDEQ